MTSRDFCYWLQGFIELREQHSGDRSMSTEQMMCVKRHLALVFQHEIDPSMGGCRAPARTEQYSLGEAADWRG